MKIKILLLLIILANIVIAQDTVSKDYYISGVQLHCPGGPIDADIGLEHSLNPRFETWFRTSFNSSGMFGNCFGVSMIKYDNTLKGDVSIGFTNQSFNNNMIINSFNIGYSKTIKIANNFFLIPEIMFNYSTFNGQLPNFHGVAQPLSDRDLIR